jgi:hypothetical protein
MAHIRRIVFSGAAALAELGYSLWNRTQFGILRNYYFERA